MAGGFNSRWHEGAVTGEQHDIYLFTDILGTCNMTEQELIKSEQDRFKVSLRGKGRSLLLQDQLDYIATIVTNTRKATLDERKKR